MIDENNDRSASAADAVGDKLKEGLDSARRTLHDARDAAASRASEFASKAAETASQQGDAVKGEISAALGIFAKAVRTAADELSKSDQSTAARLVQQAAGGLESFSGALGQKRIEDIVSDVRGFGRANPTAFLLGSVLAGVALGRFVRTSASHGATRQDAGRAADWQPSQPQNASSGGPSGSSSSGRTSGDAAAPFTPSSFNAEI